MKTKIFNEKQLVLAKNLYINYIVGGIFLIFGSIIALASIGPDQPNNGVVIVIAIILFIIGILFILFGGKKTIIFDKEKNEVLFDLNQHIKKKQKRFELNSADSITQKVRLESSNRANNSRDRMPRTVYYYTLVFKDGSYIDLGRVSRSMGSNLMSSVGIGAGNVPVFVKNVAEFLNIEINKDSMGEKIAAAGTAANVIGSIFKK